MPDANDPTTGSPSAPTPKGGEDAMINGLPIRPGNNIGSFKVSAPQQKGEEVDTFGRPKSWQRVGGEIKNAPAPEEAKKLDDWKSSKRLDLALLKAAFEQLQNSGWEVSDLDKRLSQLEGIPARVEVAKDEDRSQLEDLLAELSTWAREAQDVLQEAQSEHRLKTSLLKGEKRRLYNDLDRRANSLSGKVDKKKEDSIQRGLQSLAWLQTDDGCEEKVDELELLDLDKELSGVEKSIAEEEANLAKKAREEAEKIRREELEKKIKIVRQAATLITLFASKKAEVTTLLRTTSTTTEGQQAEELVRELDVLKIALESDNITDDDITKFKEKTEELDTVTTALHSLVEKEKSGRQEMISGNATWPREIKYFEAKKPDRTGRGGEKAAWKKDGIILNNQAIWTKANDLAKIVFVKYNTLVDKAFGAGLDEKVKGLVNSKELVIEALNQLKVEDALKELVRLEKEVGLKNTEIENELEQKDLTVKFAIAKSSLERLAAISPLERALLEGRSKEVEDLLETLRKDDTKADPSKMRELLRLCKAVLGELLTGIEDKDKDTKREAAERLSEFKKLARRLEEARVEITHKSPAGISSEDKEALLKKIAEIEDKAKDFSKHEIDKKYGEARESLLLFKSSLDALATSAQEKAAAAAKVLEAKSAEAKEFAKAVAFFEKLKSEISDLGVSGAEKAAFDRLITELEQIKASRANETDKNALDQKDLLFRTLLGDLSGFVSKKVGYVHNIKYKIDTLKQKLASTTNEDSRDQLIEKIEEQENLLKKIQSLKEEKKSTAPRKKVLRPVKDDMTVSLREKDPLTGKAIEMKVSEWRKLQKSSAEVSTIEKGERRSRAEEELRAIHKGMWQRDPEGYKKLYVERQWAKDEGSQLLRKIVTEILGEKIALVDERLEFHQAELDERNGLVRRLQSGVLTPTEKARLSVLEEQLSVWIKEKESLTENLANYPYEEQLRILRRREGGASELTEQRQTYSPAHDSAMDLYPVYGVAGEEHRKKGLSNIFRKNSDAQQRYQIAKHLADKENASSKRGSIPGFTKAAINPTPLVGKMPDPITANDFVTADPTREDLGKDMKALAEAVYKEEVKFGSKEGAANSGGMARSAMEEDLYQKRNKDGVKIPQAAYENNPEEAPRQERVLTPEEQERKVAKVNSIMGTIAKYAKSWRAWAVLGALAAGVGGPSVAFAGTTAQTLEQLLSWQDLAEGLTGRERLPEGFIKDLTSK